MIIKQKSVQSSSNYYTTSMGENKICKALSEYWAKSWRKDNTKKTK